MLAGAQFRGQFEQRLKTALEEAVAAEGRVVLFLDELHTVLGAGAAEGAMDAANMLKPLLARGELRVIGATTLAEFRKIERDGALARRFSPVLSRSPRSTTRSRSCAACASPTRPTTTRRSPTRPSPPPRG